MRKEYEQILREENQRLKELLKDLINEWPNL